MEAVELAGQFAAGSTSNTATSKLVSPSPFWRDRSTLVTGATGLVGSWLVRHLLDAGADVVCLVRDWVPQSELVRSGLLDRVRVVRGDLCDQDCLERTLGEYEVTTVMHLAAQAIVGIANRGPLSTFETNIAGTWKLLEACRRSPLVKQIIMASSDKAYGEASTLPYREDTPLEGRHPYDVSKSCADLIAQSYAITYRTPVCITRCGNFFGGGDLNWNRIVPGTLRSLLRGERPVVRSDGQFVRDYFYVEDGARAYMMLAEQLGQRPELAGAAFNFSNDLPLTVLELVQHLTRAVGSDLEPVVQGQASNEIRAQYLDSTRARTELGWQPLWTLDQALERTIAWYHQFLNSPATTSSPAPADTIPFPAAAVARSA